MVSGGLHGQMPCFPLSWVSQEVETLALAHAPKASRRSYVLPFPLHGEERHPFLGCRKCTSWKLSPGPPSSMDSEDPDCRSHRRGQTCSPAQTGWQIRRRDSDPAVDQVSLTGAGKGGDSVPTWARPCLSSRLLGPMVTSLGVLVSWASVPILNLVPYWCIPSKIMSVLSLPFISETLKNGPESYLN